MIRFAEVADEHVVRLEIAVDDPLRMGVRDGVCDRDDVRQDREPLFERRCGIDQIVQRTTGHLLHRVERPAVATVPDAVDRHDRRVLEPGCDERFVLEPALQIFAVGRDDLHSNGTAEAFAVRREHDSHPTSS
jgi:hypothetical protein